MSKQSLPARIARRLRSALNLPSPAILMYHRIADERFDPWALAVRKENFAGQLAWLKTHRVPLGLAEMVELQRRRKLPPKAVAITFDDGYSCNARVAAPLLAEHKIPATMFLTTGPIVEGKEFWWDELERIVLAVEASEMALELPRGTRTLALGEKRPDDRTWTPGHSPRTPRQKAYHEAWSALKPLKSGEQQSILEGLRSTHDLSPGPRETHRPMTKVEVRSLETCGIEVGAHSLTHTSLPDRTNEEKRQEIGGSRDRCAALTGKVPRTFAYPYGDLDDESAAIVEAFDFDCACTTLEGSVSNDDRYRLPRIQVRDWGPEQLRAALAGR
ncbi:polysaccharide deacetylase family protein [Sphingomonas sp. URHD0057]|uniref:polysaccharide deacetylase family protein n=1 Tax=Sphingomonas sp. URHD0057 TaxID=1380389 RepID=UPI00048B6EFC|nr:polysaccharide deacetylase family protein [Sphingomonas sp. URHD0057]